MSKPSGRHSRFPAVNRDVPGSGATYPERVAQAATQGVQQAAPVEAPLEEQADGPDFDSMTVAEVLEWAGDDTDRKRVALEAEVSGRNRKGVTSVLAG